MSIYSHYIDAVEKDKHFFTAGRIFLKNTASSVLMRDCGAVLGHNNRSIFKGK